MERKIIIERELNDNIEGEKIHSFLWGVIFVSFFGLFKDDWIRGETIQTEEAKSFSLNGFRRKQLKPDLRNDHK